MDVLYHGFATGDRVDALDHGCDMNVSISASMDALDHGCTTDMNGSILASMDALRNSYLNQTQTYFSCSVARKTLNYRFNSLSVV